MQFHTTCLLALSSLATLTTASSLSDLIGTARFVAKPVDITSASTINAIVTSPAFFKPPKVELKYVTHFSEAMKQLAAFQWTPKGDVFPKLILTIRSMGHGAILYNAARHYLFYCHEESRKEHAKTPATVMQLVYNPVTRVHGILTASLFEIASWKEEKERFYVGYSHDSVDQKTAPLQTWLLDGLTEFKALLNIQGDNYEHLIAVCSGFLTGIDGKCNPVSNKTDQHVHIRAAVDTIRDVFYRRYVAIAHHKNLNIVDGMTQFAKYESQSHVASVPIGPPGESERSHSGGESTPSLRGTSDRHVETLRSNERQAVDSPSRKRMRSDDTAVSSSTVSTTTTSSTMTTNDPSKYGASTTVNPLSLKPSAPLSPTSAANVRKPHPFNLLNDPDTEVDEATTMMLPAGKRPSFFPSYSLSRHSSTLPAVPPLWSYKNVIVPHLTPSVQAKSSTQTSIPHPHLSQLPDSNTRKQ